MALASLLKRVKKADVLWRRDRSLLAELRSLRQQLNSQSKACPVCLARFENFVGFRKRPHARCPQCGAFERHRLSWLYLKSNTALFREPTRFLHFAPEEFLRARIASNLNVSYTAASYNPAQPDQGIDIQRLPFADGSFDLVFCSHVLEHVPDDRLAMRELLRVLAPGGRALIMIPLRNVPDTYEDFSITEPEERTKHFGQYDHVRWYGRDVLTRLREAGFQVKIVYHTEALSLDEQVRYGVAPEPIFDCQRAES
jgi:SAM-dependent methyltransferase